MSAIATLEEIGISEIRLRDAMDITSNTYLKLMVAEKADQSEVDALGERMDAAELKITPDAIVSTVTGSQQYQDDLASVSVSGSGIEMIVGTQTTSTASWTGVSAMFELKDGVQIAFWLPQSSGANVTLNLTLADGSTTGAIPCYFSAGTRLGTQYSAGNVIRLTYRENAKYYSSTIAKGWWADANYNTDTYDRIRHGTVKAKETCAYFRLIVSDSEGYYSCPEDRHLAIPYDMVLAADMDELNFLATRLGQLDAAEIAELNAALQNPRGGFESIGQIIDYTENVDYYVHLPDVMSAGQLGD